MTSIVIILLVAALIMALLCAIGKCQEWVPIILLCIVGLLEHASSLHL